MGCVVRQYVLIFSVDFNSALFFWVEFSVYEVALQMDG